MRKKITWDPKLTLGGKQLKFRSSTKFLGLTFDKKTHMETSYSLPETRRVKTPQPVKSNP